MAYKSDIARFVVGEPIRCIAKLRTNTSYQKEDIKINDRMVQLVDSQNKLVGDFEANDVYNSTYSARNILELSLTSFVGIWTKGYNVSFMAHGTTGSGKSYLMEGNRQDPGLILLVGDVAFTLLNKKQADIVSSGKAKSFSYSLRMKYVEIVNEEITDLLAFSYNSDLLKAVNNEWEGPTVANATWVSVNSIDEYNDFFLRGQTNRTRNVDEFGRQSSKAAGLFLLELTQFTEAADSEQLVTISKMYFFDLPSLELLDENQEAVISRQGPTLNKSLFAYNTLVQNMVTSRGERPVYDTSMLTTLIRDAVGGNSYTVAFICLQYGDTRGSLVALKFMNMLRQIRNYPTFNEGKTIGLMRRYRSEAIQAFENLQAMIGNNMDGLALNQLDIEKKLIEENLNRMEASKENERLSKKIVELRDQYNTIVQKLADVRAELIASEEEKIQISKTLIEFQIENAKLLEMMQNEKYDANNKIVDQEAEFLALNIREEKALELVTQLQDRLKQVLEEKRELEIEFVALKKNFLNLRDNYEEEKRKNENLGIELINTVNENKALQAELNQAYKNSSSTTEEGAKLSGRLDNLQRQYDDQREALLMAKAEIERLKTEILRYQLKDDQYKLEIEAKRLDLEKGYIDMAKDKDKDMRMISKTAEDTLNKNMQDKMVFESQRTELIAKNKQLNRRIEELEEKLKEFMNQVSDMKSKNSQLSTKMDEMDSLYRAKLMQYAMEEKVSKDKKMVGFNAREDLIRSYREKEVELMEKLDKERGLLRGNKTELTALKNYARELKYLAEDWAPLGKPLPEILSRPMPTGEENQPLNLNQGMRNATEDNILEENDRLKKRNLKLEEDVRRMNDQFMNQAGMQPTVKGNSSYLNTGNMGSEEVDELRRDKNQLREENEKLLRQMKESGQYDVYVLRKEIERLHKVIKEFENNYGNASPESGDIKVLSQKIGYYEKAIRQLENERSELLSRATMAEEQLKSLQQHMSKITTEYQKNMLELKRKLGAS
jgi:hypothetical protein